MESHYITQSHVLLQKEPVGLRLLLSFRVWFLLHQLVSAQWKSTLDLSVTAGAELLGRANSPGSAVPRPGAVETHCWLSAASIFGFILVLNVSAIKPGGEKGRLYTAH
ncbi:hypothetical protein WMY93_024379 [Mugilogobius chulae]|uniref:Uncharacterized protein n=1 Tax=Mugilogobius chulae TaxID=88201 RepID=A0AAW0N3U8_9GOBI